MKYKSNYFLATLRELVGRIEVRGSELADKFFKLKSDSIRRLCRVPIHINIYYPALIIINARVAIYRAIPSGLILFIAATLPFNHHSAQMQLLENCVNAMSRMQNSKRTYNVRSVVDSESSMRLAFRSRRF